MQNTTYKLCAVGCCAAYILTFLFLPFVALKFVGIGITGLHSLSINALAYLILAFGIGMGICSVALPGKTAGIIDAVGAALTLIVYFIFQGVVIGDGLSLASAIVPGLGAAISGLGASAIGQMLTAGAGVIIPMLFAGTAAALCFLSERAPQQSAKRTAGLGSSADDEW